MSNHSVRTQHEFINSLDDSIGSAPGKVKRYLSLLSCDNAEAYLNALVDLKPMGA